MIATASTGAVAAMEGGGVSCGSAVIEMAASTFAAGIVRARLRRCRPLASVGGLVGDDVVAAAGCDLVERDGEQLGELEVRPVDDRAECFPRHQ